MRVKVEGRCVLRTLNVFICNLYISSRGIEVVGCSDGAYRSQDGETASSKGHD